MVSAIQQEIVQYELIYVKPKKAKKTKYYALSYTWGPDSQPRQRLRLADGKYLTVRNNLYQIMYDTSLFLNKEYLWIDAICINQEDNAEKGSQVARMSEIYSNAEEVIVWVGDRDQDSDLAMDALGQIREKFSPIDAAFENKDDPKYARAYAYWTKLFREVNPIHNPEWDLSYLGRFMCRPWFERVWIIQEVVMGQKVRLWCGMRSIDWNSFAYAILTLQLYGLARLLVDTKTMSPSSGFQNCTSLATWRNARLTGGSDFRVLASLLISSCNFKSTDPRDRVYAFLGITSDYYPGLKPDYECTVQQAFSDSTRAMLLEAKGLLVLAAAGIGYHRPIPHLPSWVPDWTSTGGRNYFNAAPYSGFHATDARPPQIRATRVPSLITIDGICMDKITALHALPHIHGLQRDERGEFDTNVLRMANILEKEFAESAMKFACTTFPNLPVQQCEEVLWRTLCGNTGIDGEPLPAEYGKYYRSRVELNAYHAESTCVPTTEEQDHIRLLSIDAGMFASAMTYFGNTRRLCRTARGYLGLVAPETKVGDVVCLLLGGDAPFVLRPSGAECEGKGTYVLVGDCYVHGLMHEEGMTVSDIQEFILC